LGILIFSRLDWGDQNSISIEEIAEKRALQGTSNTGGEARQMATLYAALKERAVLPRRELSVAPVADRDQVRHHRNSVRDLHVEQGFERLQF
jgi:hypothetical protein